MALRDILLSGSANRQTIIHFPNGEHEDIDSGIYSGSMKLNRILCNSSNLQYGECNAASFQAQITNISDLSGVKIYVYQKIETEIVPLFTGIIDSCKVVRNKSYRKLVAYDEIYSVNSSNIVDWYNNLFDKNTSYTLKQFRDSFFSYIGIEQEETELINDDITIEKTIQTDSLKAGDVMYAICQINGCFGNMTPEGKFRYVDLDTGEAYDVSDNLKNTTSYEEYVTKAIDKLMVLSDEDELNISVGSGDNTYTIKGNFLIYGYETETLRIVAGRIFQKIRYISYRPADIKTILSEINIQLGDKIIVTDNNISFITYVLKESFSGVQLLTQTIQAEGEEKYADVINDVNGDIRELKLKQSTILSSLQTEYLKAETAELTYISSSELTTIEANITNAVIGSLSAEFATVDYLETNYAQINLANVEKATIGTVLADVGLITNATIVDGHVTGYLDSVNINANSITAGDLSVERLIIRGSENSIVYALNNITGALQAQNVDTINGEVLTQRTVTADRLVAKSITANEIAAAAISVNELNVSNIFGNEAVLNTITASSIFSNAIAANSVVVGAKNTAINALNAINSLEIGGRNILINSSFQNSSSANWTITGYGSYGPTSRYGKACFGFIMTELKLNRLIKQSVLGKLEPNTQYTLSGWILTENIVKGTTNPLIGFYQDGYYDNGGTTTWFGYGYQWFDLNSGTGEWKHITWTFTTDEKVKIATYLDVYVYTRDYTGQVYFYDLKLEKGNKATDWTPAPEDISVENIYKENTTLIDGGKIYTRTVTADKLSVSSLSAITANLGTVKIGGSNNGNGVLEIYNASDELLIKGDNTGLATTKLINIDDNNQSVIFSNINYSYGGASYSISGIDIGDLTLGTGSYLDEEEGGYIGGLSKIFAGESFDLMMGNSRYNVKSILSCYYGEKDNGGIAPVKAKFNGDVNGEEVIAQSIKTTQGGDLDLKLGIHDRGTFTYEVKTFNVIRGDIIVVSFYGSGGLTLPIFIYSSTYFMTPNKANLQTSFAITSLGDNITLDNGVLKLIKTSNLTQISYIYYHINK